ELGSVKLGSLKLGLVKLGLVKLGPVKLGPVGPGLVKLGQWPGPFPGSHSLVSFPGCPFPFQVPSQVPSQVPIPRCPFPGFLSQVPIPIPGILSHPRCPFQVPFPGAHSLVFFPRCHSRCPFPGAHPRCPFPFQVPIPRCPSQVSFPIPGAHSRCPFQVSFPVPGAIPGALSRSRCPFQVSLPVPGAIPGAHSRCPFPGFLSQVPSQVSFPVPGAIPGAHPGAPVMDPLSGLACGSAVLVALALVALVALVALAQRWGLLYRLWHKVDPHSPRHGGELVAEVLRAHGVRFLFTLPGGHISPVLVAAQKVGIRVVGTRHEATAVFAADAVSRLSGRVGVAAVTAGPGVTNAVTAMKNAQLAEVPLLLLGGAAASLQKGRGALQDIEQLALFRPLCKVALTVGTVRDIVPTLRRAFAIAQGGTPGPVFVELPIDVLYPFHVVEKELCGTRSGHGLGARVVQWFLRQYLHNLFAGAWEPRAVTPLPVQVPLGSDHQVQSCAELLSRARRPLVLVGSQSLLPPVPAEELSSALQSLGIPCYLGGAARGLLPPECPLLLRHQRREALREADLVLLAGTVCDFRLSYGRLFGRGTAVVSVNRDRQQLLRNSDVFWKPRLAVQGDPASFVVALAKKLQGLSCPKEWLEKLQERDREKEQQNREKAAVPPPQHLNPLALLQHLDRVLPPNSVLVADGGDFVGTAAYIVRPRRPRAWLDPGPFGTLGVGGGFALGAKLCRPEAEVWVLFGDGSVGFSLLEFDTFVRHKVPVIALVGNDACWTQICREQVALLGSDVGCALSYLDYHRVAEALGGRGLLVARGDSAGDSGDSAGDSGDRVAATLRMAQDLCRQGHPVLVNALIGTTDFRHGSISV
ncbi:LOW QUALITY PROTEIN: 2-hydroxyacyl-CoA lyase 2-like, partial [Pithys albifrons albifrons]|uniref:LOW QUALITY PROTEIN: 2-hydroxyacyl-CoA lyase 2-like n=1 Tax=Pithys albifrons albifrons TaxID=3385563 RepID=UPI003A5D08F7